MIDPADFFGIIYGYDTLSRLINASYSDGSIITYAYDAAGNRTNLTIVAGTNADSDRDGMPDTWEIAHGLNPNDSSDANQDPDGDGFTNLQEYFAGTDPHNATSGLFITLAERVGSDIRISFSSIIGKQYLLEWKDDLISGTWNSAGSSMISNGGIAQMTQTGGALQNKRFYRIRLLP